MFPEWLVTALDSSGDGFLSFADTAATGFFVGVGLLLGTLGAFLEKRHIT